MDSILVKNLVKRYQKADKNAIDDVSLSVKEGEFYALLGPNGAGKTTTISVLTTTLAMTSGQVTIGGFDLDKDPKHVREHIGVIFQGHSLDLNLTAEENVRLHTILYGLYPFRPTFSLMPAGYQKRVKDLAHILDLKDEMFKPVKTFSGGMKRKLEIIRSLMHNPKVLFLDEPTSGLDPLSRKNLWEYLQEVRKSNKTTIFLTTHYLDEAEGADRICIINKGKVLLVGTPSKVKQNLKNDYVALNAKDSGALEKELHKLRVTFTKKETYKIMMSEEDAPMLIQKIKTPLSYLRIHSPSLEEAYLEIIEKERHNES